MFVGRNEELTELNHLYKAKTSKLAVLYGRRRIGKSFLIEHFCKNKSLIRFEGLEGEETPAQIKSFTNDLIKQINDPILKSVHFKNWIEVFDYLTTYLAKEKTKTILFFDEFQWLAAGHGTLVSLLKKYWDQHWRKENTLIILCGSISSYMVNKVIKSKALYGRIDWEHRLDSLNIAEAYELIKRKRSKEELLQYMLILGGIPRYLESIDVNKSFDQNMNNLFFRKDGLFVNEYEKVFYSQFKEHKIYEKIVMFICEKPKTLEEIAKHLKMPSGGGLKSYLENLKGASFITAYKPYDKFGNTKLIRYKLTDEYLRFYFKFIRPNLAAISVSTKTRNLFNNLTNGSLSIWLGFAFENLCLKDAFFLAEVMGFADKVKSFGPAFSRASQGFQVDLLYLRSDKTITLCEMKYYNKQVDHKIIKDVELKSNLLTIPKGHTLEKALISIHGPNQTLKELDYFHHTIQLEDFFE
jgi:uncharacterized protein